MFNCCKYAKWFPHNWLCLKGLSVVFTILFYLTLVYGLWQMVLVMRIPEIDGYMRATILFNLAQIILALALIMLTVAKALKALYKIKKAVAPCCCNAESKEEGK